MKEQKISRKELYDLVWSEPFTTIVKKYGISDTGLRKICKRMEIPFPKLGHWMKIQHNKPVEIIQLPEDYSGETEVTLNLLEEGDQKNIGILGVQNVAEKGIIESEGEQLIVSERLTNPHPYIVTSKEFYTKKITYEHKEYHKLLEKTVNIEVTSDQVLRALRIMDTFIKLMEKRGHKVIIRNRSTIVVIQEQEIEIKIREKYKKIPIESNYSWQQYKHVATGILVFQIVQSYNDVYWQDGKFPLEEQIAKIIAKLELRGEELRLREIEWAKHREIEREKKRIEEEMKKRKEKEFNDVKALLLDAKLMNIAEILRSYIIKLDDNVIKSGNLNKERLEYIAWARKKADWLDPLVIKQDEYLNESDKEKLLEEKDKKNERFDYYRYY